MYLVLLWSAVIVSAVYLYFQQLYSSFRRHGVKSLPAVPFFGNMAKVIMRKEHVVHVNDRLYNNSPNEKFVGRFEYMKKILVVKDPELIKNIVIKDFEHFVDHRSLVNDENDPLLGRNLIALTGQEWRDMRGTLSPTFTSSKIRNMVPFIVEVAEQMISAVKKNITKSGGYLDIDVKDLTSRVSNDVIATCAFGLKVESQKDPNNAFFNMGQEIVSLQFRGLLVLLGYSSFPKLMKYLKISLFSSSLKNFFKSLVLSTMKNREEKNIVRPDMIHLLMEAKKGKLSNDDNIMKEKDTGFATVEESSVGKKAVFREWSDNDLVAQAIVFFLAGFETISSALCFLLYELARNPDIQERLVNEIKETHAKNGGKFDFSSVQNMTYLDMVLSETLRRWPIASFLDRLCVKDYNCGKPNDKAEKDYIVRKGDALEIPVWQIHHDPNYFPDPLKFDPERFSDENKHNIKPFTYMPFGMGPRNCIGSRFALTEIKVVVYHLLQELEVSPCEKTNTAGEISPSTVNITLEGGHWLRFRIRA